VLRFDKTGKILEMMNRKVKNEIKDWFQLLGWVLFVISFIYLLITVKNF